VDRMLVAGGTKLFILHPQRLLLFILGDAVVMPEAFSTRQNNSFSSIHGTDISRYSATPLFRR